MSDEMDALCSSGFVPSEPDEAGFVPAEPDDWMGCTRVLDSCLLSQMSWNELDELDSCPLSRMSWNELDWMSWIRAS
jgi:hypothetical protein